MDAVYTTSAVYKNYASHQGVPAPVGINQQQQQQQQQNSFHHHHHQQQQQQHSPEAMKVIESPLFMAIPCPLFVFNWLKVMAICILFLQKVRMAAMVLQPPTRV